MADSDPPKTDAERIADLEKQVDALRNVCAYLHNAVTQTQAISVYLGRSLLFKMQTGEVPPEMVESATTSDALYKEALLKAAEIIWGQNVVK